MPKMSRRGPKGGPGSTIEPPATRSTMASRVDKLEDNLQSGLRDLKKQLLGDKDSSGSPPDIAGCLEKISLFEKRALEEIRSLKQDISNIETTLCNYKQEMMSNSIVINGIVEKQGINTCEEVSNFIKSYLNIDISPSDIDFCYRLGRPDASQKNRPLAVRFVNRWLRDGIFNKKKNLKGSGFVISEQLINKNLVLYKKVRAIVGAKNTWTWKGKVYVAKNNIKKQIHNISEVEG